MLSSFRKNTANLELEPSLLNAFMGLGDILSRTREHLAIYDKNGWGGSKFNSYLDFLLPSRVTQQLIRDEQQLSHQLTIILFFFSTSSFIRELHLPAAVAKVDLVSFRPIWNEDVRVFWCDFVGAKVLFAQSDRFLEALRYRFGNQLNDAARQRFFLRLDEFKIGGVAISTLECFVGDDSLEQAVKKFQALDTKRPLAWPLNNEKRLPLLIWVDDRPENNSAIVQFARQAGVCVLEFLSTAFLKAWMEENQDFLRSNDRADSVRFISDTARFETDDQRVAQNNNSYLNIAAGENIARYLRGYSYRAPLLIFCGTGIIYTGYVKSYDATGSTCSPPIVYQYITALSQRRRDDKNWHGYNVVAK
ncbi:hypothetical protein E4T56_gene11441 [Termitomyces sp. T112]|nr:hypothetical protein C0989_004251 [Termitomyces sp. Mn162]KAG5732259.1 hypothetical protein E4T56_gene11441 [Termitomyces sp. T112]